MKYYILKSENDPQIVGSGFPQAYDFISNPFNAIMMSLEARMIFDDFKIAPTHRFYKMGLYVRKVKFDYWWLDLKSDQLDFVDYPNTTFVIEKNDTNSNINANIEITDKNDYLAKRENIIEEKGIYSSIAGVKIHMNKQFDKELDLFKIGWLDASTYISERLVEAIHSNSLTGWQFLPADHLIID